MEQMTTLRDLVGQVIQKKEEEKRIAEEQAAKDRYWKIPICYDDDEDNTIAITPVLPIEEPDNSLKETNTFDNSIPESETFRFNLEEISSGSPTTHSELSLPDYKAFYFPPADRSDFNHEEFTDELTHIMPLPELECFKFKIEPDPGDLTSIDLGDFPDCEDSRACSIHKNFTSSASFWKSKVCKGGTPPVESVLTRMSLLRKKFKEDLFTYYVENEFFEDLQDTSESSDDNTNVVNAPQEPFVGNQDPGKNSSPSPLHIDHCCHECGDSLDGIFCRQCTCKSCEKGAHYGYNCPPRVPIISNSEPCKNQTIDEHLQNLQSLQQQCLFHTCQKCGCNEYDGVSFYCKVGMEHKSIFHSVLFLTILQVLQAILYNPNTYHTPSEYVERLALGYDCQPQVPFCLQSMTCVFNSKL
ncbi:hypothetical protein Tco_1295066 [Tanacetum coccineum]